MSAKPPVQEVAFESVIEAHFLANGFVPVSEGGFDRERAIFPEVVLGFIRETLEDGWVKPYDPNQGKKYAKYLPKWA